MRVINVHEAKTHLSRLLDRVAAGEEIIIAKANRPMARLLPLEPETSQRMLGTGKGEIWMSDDFDEPLSDDELAVWESGDLIP